MCAMLRVHSRRNRRRGHHAQGSWRGPLPNSKRHVDARWDACLDVSDPDALAEEFRRRNVEFSEKLAATHDGLRGFEVRDADGYVLFFGRPR